jgi:hypothetical protein
MAVSSFGSNPQGAEVAGSDERGTAEPILMKFDDQERNPRIAALAGAIRLKARLQPAITRFDRYISLDNTITAGRRVEK